MTGIVDFLAKNAPDQEGHRRFVFVKTKDGHVVADAGLCGHASKYGKWVKGHLATMERKQKLMIGEPEEFREKLFQEVRSRTTGSWRRNLSWSRKRVMKERKRTGPEEWRVSDDAGGAVTWKAASGAQALEQESVFLTGETIVSNAVWKDMIRQKISRGRLSAGFWLDGFIHRMW